MKKVLVIVLVFLLALAVSLPGSVNAEMEMAEEQHLKSFLSAEPTTLDSGKASDMYALTMIMAIRTSFWRRRPWVCRAAR